MYEKITFSRNPDNILKALLDNSFGYSIGDLMISTVSRDEKKLKHKNRFVISSLKKFKSFFIYPQSLLYSIPLKYF